MIKTKNLQLRAVKPIHVELFWRNRDELAILLQTTLPKNWPHFSEAFSPNANETADANSGLTHWCGYFFIWPAGGVLVGNGGFKGPPDRSGTVEIGYEIAADYWNRGFATEAAQGMIDYAFAQREVQTVIAHTLAEENASNRVLQKVGMRYVAEVDNSELGKIYRWQISRKEYKP
ncbi:MULTISPECIES: GNAT family N-acetyltransferase [Cyanophyceae]|uniref:GNAT family N-acetyltransferase n=1 Tax=Leptolyngbya subtilissima DQ-A4 TaxID=2933933 RepID=A0ABV0K430_9CYAN|nr:GNAT family N-acetyltransferase [Nodosilinea sp. FACHB-141]MBD2113216.1 GNAT family N-acetyltransferase [Nodosilinea sp. FACHB-141]